VEERGPAWHQLARDDPYPWLYLGQHLIAAGRGSELRELLLDPRWLDAKLRVAGLSALLRDFDAFAHDAQLARIASALRLSALKATSLKDQFAGALIIGSDQVAALGDERLDKPGSHDNAVRQLRRVSGKAVDFHTAVALFDTATSKLQSTVVPCRVTFRALDEARIQRYLRREQPYDCAGSAKAEGLGIALVARMQTDDPTSLIGLPLIALTEMLESAGFAVL
jgi:septum formation protein